MKKSIVNKLVALMPLLLVCNFINAQWFTGGNFVVPGQFLGSTNTMPLDIHTDNAFRLRVNPIGLTNINGSMVQTNGYVGINTAEPRSYLHINGPNNTFFPGGGYRRWMQTGVFNLENSDNLFTGLLPMGVNRSDAVWVWGDDSSGEPTNYSRFIFTGAAGVDGTCTDCPTNSTGREGREVMRLAPNGRVGIGPLFESNGIQSNIHNHMEGTLPVWFQQSNETGTGGLATDGLRIGISSNSNAYMFNQENNPLIFSTGNTTSQLSRERFRITHVGVPGMPNNGGYPDNFTRIGISLNPLSPVSQPRTLIHMGANVAEIGPSTQGWRPWMNTGIYMNEQLDNMYVGLKFEGTQRADAVVAWGANQTVEDGQDNLRFIFARSALSGGGDAESVSNDGLEVGRFAPTGNFGIGNFYTNGLSEQPTQKLDVDGTARLRQVPANEPHVLITGRKQDVDPTDGDYVLNYLGFSGNSNEVLNGDGVWVEMAAADCDWEVIENVPGIDDVVTGHGDDCYPAGHAGVGVVVPQAKLDVYHSQTQVNPKAQAGLIRWDESLVSPFGLAHGLNVQLRRADEFGLMGQGIYCRASGSERNWAGRFDAMAGTVSADNVGIEAISNHHISSTVGYESTGGRFQGSALFSEFIGRNSYGVQARAMGGTNAIGIFASAGGAAVENWSGYFVGDTWCTAMYQGSDASLKQNVEPLENALEVIQQIDPKSYEFLTDQYSQMNLPTGIQQGLIAQELEEVVPHLVKATTFPAQYDTLGNVVSEAYEFKSVNYTGLIPYLIAGMKEQQTIIESQNEVLAQMMEQLANMQQQINQCCNASDDSKSMPGGAIQPQDLNNQKSIEGGNELYQNIPNPFRESTTISYLLEQGGRVQLSVYDSNGKVITTLVDARQDSGRHSTVWNANGMPSGVYHYALYVDGELLVKRAIKLQE